MMLFSPLMIQACLLRWSSRKIFQEREKKSAILIFVVMFPILLLHFTTLFFLPSQLQKFQGGWSWTCHAPLYSFSSYISKGRPNSSCSAFKTRSITCNESAYSNFSLFIVSPEYWWCLSSFLKYFHLTRIRHFLKQIEAIQFQFKKCGVFLSSFFGQEIFSTMYLFSSLMSKNYFVLEWKD